MTTLGRSLLVAALLAALAAIWAPAYWWQLGLTALLLFIVAASILGQHTTNRKDH